MYDRHLRAQNDSHFCLFKPKLLLRNVSAAFTCQHFTENGGGAGFAKIENALHILFAPGQEIRLFLFGPGGGAADKWCCKPFLGFAAQ